jgi:hypothetical protein
MRTLNREWEKFIFTEGQGIIVYKESLFAPPSTLPGEFFVLNPMRECSAKLQDVAEFRNILIEVDGIKVEDQWEYVTKELQLPFSLCTYSGNQSLHFILSLNLEKGAIDLNDYRTLVELVYAAADTEIVDPACRNANRLTRTPGAARSDTKLEQEFIEGRGPIEYGQLDSWLMGDPQRRERVFNKRQELAAKAALTQASEEYDGPPAQLPQIYEDFVNGKALHPNGHGSRHNSLIKLGVWLKHRGYDNDAARRIILQAVNAWGILDTEAARVIEWLKI